MIENKGIQKKYTSTGRHSGYHVNLFHSELHEHKYLIASELEALEGKMKNQELSWALKWEKENAKRKWLSNDDKAKERTEEAQKKLSEIEGLLSYTLSIDDALDWESLKNFEKFSSEGEKHDFIQFREGDGFPKSIYFIDIPQKPKESDYFLKIGFIPRLLGQEGKIRSQQNNAYSKASQSWDVESKRISADNDLREEALSAKRKLWELEKEKFLAFQEEHNKSIDTLKEMYEKKDPEAVADYFDLVLRNSHYPVAFPKDFAIEYNPATEMLLLDYELPALSKMPSLVSVRFVKSRGDFDEKEISQAAREKLYDSAIYQIILRTVHEIFESDVIQSVKAISFNGVVNDVNPSSGHVQTNCIVSLQVGREEFEKINLGMVDPKQCFKSLKGVGSSKLSTMTAIKPILELNKSDKRFRDHYAVAGDLNDDVNLAAMDWEDFEHLVREIFEKEFSVNGGEVRITQASVDGGVDAVAFDPDPIRGGKIVIQAKRYTNVVGVSAVRDLYGTMMNEGAMKGILVTTSDYGSDSYDFAKDKPIALLSGSNLLHLLSKHGHKAKIDIKEAKRILKEK